MRIVGLKNHRRWVLAGIAAGVLMFAMPAWARTPSSPGANVYIVSPVHGEVVRSPVRVRFGLQGMGVAPAGVAKPGTGHHHLLIDVERLPPLDRPLPKDANHRHFGGGQTEVWLDLPPGKHTLRLILGDHDHVPHDPPLVSEAITIEVVP